jgi:leucyl aminopeptidase
MALTVKYRSTELAVLDSPLLVVALAAEEQPPPSVLALDALLGGAISRTFARRDFRGTRDETLHLSGAATGVERVLLIGMGKVSERPAGIKRAAAIAARRALSMGTGHVDFYAGAVTEEEAEAATVGLVAGAWEYKDLKVAPPDEERRRPLESAAVLADDQVAAARGVAAGVAIGEGHSLARRLAMMPGNLCTPDYLAKTARDIAARFGMQVTVLGRAEMEREGMGSFLSVAQGTPEDPKLIALEYRGGRPGAPPVALVGKGLCFDTGGISIKPAQSMELMKFDMCGAAGVLGACEAIGRLQLPVNVVGLIGATTNMPSGTAVKPGDVVRASNGKHIEIINTDAEGRLVLADLLVYAKRFNPTAVVDAATLTGACVIALGHTATGVMGSDEGLVQEVIAAGRRAGEPCWQLPLWEDYRELIKSDVADVKNSGGRPAGTISAALFLKEFVDGYAWAHLDIAGTAYSETDLVTIPRGPTGVPTGTFVEFVRGRAR